MRDKRRTDSSTWLRTQTHTHTAAKRPRFPCNVGLMPPSSSPPPGLLHNTTVLLLALQRSRLNAARKTLLQAPAATRTRVYFVLFQHRPDFQTSRAADKESVKTPCGGELTMSGTGAQQGWVFDPPGLQRMICTVSGWDKRSGCFTAGETKTRDVSELQMRTRLASL